jgi:hypothetical protein
MKSNPPQLTSLVLVEIGGLNSIALSGLTSDDIVTVLTASGNRGTLERCEGDEKNLDIYHASGYLVRSK